MKNNKFVLIVVFIVIILLGIQQYFIWTTPRVDDNQILLNKINKLESKIDSLNEKKDSIRMIIDSTHVKIVTNEKHYQERINTILVQSASSDSGFIADYIRQYSEQNSLFNSK